MTHNLDRAHSFLNDPGATRQQKAIARSIIAKHEQAAKDSGQIEDHYHDEPWPEDDF